MQKVIEDEKMDVTAHLVNGVCDVLKSEINDPKQQFNLGNLETVNCPNGQLELDDGIWPSTKGGDWCGEWETFSLEDVDNPHS